MFKKIIFIIIFAGVAALFFFALTGRGTNDKRCSNGGQFKDDRYINEHCGLEVNVGGNWVYCDEEGLRSFAGANSSVLNIDSSDFESDLGNNLMFAVRPGIVISVMQLDSAFDHGDLTNETMYYYSESVADVFRDDGYVCTVSDHGLLGGTDGIYFCEISYSSRTVSGDIIYAFFNSNGVGMMITAFAENETGAEIIKSFIKDNMKIKNTAPDGTSV